jgi:hypothetical protein
MSLVPNKKNKKDNRPGGGNATAKPGFAAAQSKGKLNSKGVVRNTKLTGGSQRGS